MTEPSWHLHWSSTTPIDTSAEALRQDHMDVVHPEIGHNAQKSMHNFHVTLLGLVGQRLHGRTIVAGRCWHPEVVQRVLILGRGGAGKSTFARSLGEALELPVVELDAHFWQADLKPLSAREWTETQARLASAPRWVMDGDLGPY